MCRNIYQSVQEETCDLHKKLFRPIILSATSKLDSPHGDLERKILVKQGGVNAIIIKQTFWKF